MSKQGAVLVFEEPTSEKPRPMRVGELVRVLKQEVEHKYRRVWVVGEVSSFKPWRSGHWYFDLKDEQAVLPAVMFQASASLVKFAVSDGLLVMAQGRVSIYEPQSKLQMVVEKLEPLGQGALALAFEQLKAKLLAEGLFDEAHKVPLPLLPRVVGLVTSPQGAVLRDMVRILKSRLPQVSIVCAPAKVQGPGAKEELAFQLKNLDQSGLCDVIILGRGGGSLEDLWAFNEELLARAVYACKTPVVSAVGHETDTSICDFVADLRCATPTHAAQVVVPDSRDWQERLAATHNRLRHMAEGQLKKQALRCERLAKRLGEPRLLLLQQSQRLDVLSQRAQAAMEDLLEQRRARLRTLQEALVAFSPQALLVKKRNRLQQLSERLWKEMPSKKLEKAFQQNALFDARLKHGIAAKRNQASHELAALAQKLDALSPLKVLSRGYALVQDEETEEVVTGISQLKLHEKYRIRWADGTCLAQVVQREETLIK